jgi:hypothetical protein
MGRATEDILAELTVALQAGNYNARPSELLQGTGTYVVEALCAACFNTRKFPAITFDNKGPIGPCPVCVLKLHCRCPDCLTPAENERWTMLFDKAKQILLDAGVPVSESRFPYTYHHDWVRNHPKFAGKSRSDIGHKIYLLSLVHGDEAVRPLLLAGCIYSLMQEHPAEFARAMQSPDVIELVQSVSKAVGGKYDPAVLSEA